MISSRLYQVAAKSNMKYSSSIVLNTEYYIISYLYFLQQPPDMIYGIFRKSQISKIKVKLYHVKILMPKSSFGDLYWFENQYVIVNFFLKKVKKKHEYSPHDVSINKNMFMQYLTIK